jgi:transcriptional regulator with XRE-family HTH domain
MTGHPIWGLAFPSLLASLRTNMGLSQNALAKLAGIDAGYINRMERGPTNPSSRVIHALADALALTPPERDCLLYRAGLAPTRDYQSLYEALCARVGGQN